jgi:hypothetical protein
MRAVDPGYEVQAGEFLLDHYPPEPGEMPAYDAALAAQATAQANATLQTQMDALDGGGQARAVRVALLAILPVGDEQARLQVLETQIAALRAQLVP